jgi:hypothetical protein
MIGFFDPIPAGSFGFVDRDDHSLSLATTRLGGSDLFDRAQGRPDVPEQPKAPATQRLPT